MLSSSIGNQMCLYLAKPSLQIFPTIERQKEVLYTYFDVIAVHYMKRSFIKSWYHSDANLERSE